MSPAAEIRTAKMSKEDEVKAKAIRIYRYLIRGWQPTEIAKAEGVRLEQVYWYIQEGGRILSGELKLVAKRGILRELFLSYQEIKKELWSTYHSAKQDTARVSVLQRLMELNDKLLDLAERMGLITQKPLSLEGKITWAEIIQLANVDGTPRNRIGHLLDAGDRAKSA